MKDTVSHYLSPPKPLTSTAPQPFPNNLTMPSRRFRPGLSHESLHSYADSPDFPGVSSSHGLERQGDTSLIDVYLDDDHLDGLSDGDDIRRVVDPPSAE